MWGPATTHRGDPQKEGGHHQDSLPKHHQDGFLGNLSENVFYHQIIFWVNLLRSAVPRVRTIKREMFRGFTNTSSMRNEGIGTVRYLDLYKHSIGFLRHIPYISTVLAFYIHFFRNFGVALGIWV